MTARGWTEVLPCGRDTERLLGLVADQTPIGPGSHEAACRYCQAALGELAGLWEPVTQWAALEVTAPADLVRTVIARVRRIAQSPHHVATATSLGVTTVTSWVVSLIAGQTAADTAGVAGVTSPGGRRRGSDRTERARGAADGVEVTESGAAAVGLRFGMAVAPAGDLVGLADDVRRRVIDQVRSEAGIQAAEVDIVITDLVTGD
ncbi:MAG: Asp23/Gls24 family envelope stress response protein [Actinomycetota bacterium]|nr:Asp23/Gls24 family envelope stress response protein [Actinomycetota bacterium]